MQGNQAPVDPEVLDTQPLWGPPAIPVPNSFPAPASIMNARWSGRSCLVYGCKPKDLARTRHPGVSPSGSNRSVKCSAASFLASTTAF